MAKSAGTRNPSAPNATRLSKAAPNPMSDARWSASFIQQSRKMTMNSAFMMKSMPERSTGSSAATYDPTAANPAQYARLRPVIHA